MKADKTTDNELNINDAQNRLDELLEILYIGDTRRLHAILPKSKSDKLRSRMVLTRVDKDV